MGISFRLVLSFNVIIQDSCTWYIPGSNATRSTIAYMWSWCNILYTFQSEKKIDLYTPHVIHKDLNITVIGQVEDALQLCQLQKKILIRSWTGKIFCWNWRHNCKTISEQSLEMSKRNTSGKIAEVFVACMLRWQMLYSELIITQYLLWS